MTKEQAIEKIKWSIHIRELTKNINGSNASINVEVLKTVLSILEEKDKQIDKLKKHNDDLLRKLRNRVKDVKKLQKYSLYKKEFSRLNKQVQNKDKIIDLMAEEFKEKTLMYSDFTKEEVKQYFENKAKEVE